MVNGKLLILALVLGGLTGCGVIADRLGIGGQISHIEAQDAGQSVRLEGEVTQQAAFLEGGAYAVADRSGQIWVLTRGELPAVGDRLMVQGEVVYEDIGIEGMGEVYIQELDRQKIEK
ncbi:hypothetical protein VB712_17485 [Spirulina sp. CCNP1310]|nr:hypothetical protein [Spirulina sp. CCNP1310]